MRLITLNQATAAKRRVYFHLVDATDGITAETGEAAGQPQISTNGAAFTNTGIGTLTSMGSGRYYAELTQAAVNGAAGDVIETRYKSAETAESPGDSVQVLAFDLDTATQGVNVTQISGDSTAADNLETMTDRNSGFYHMYAGSRGPGVWIDDAAANTATVVGVDGTPLNPVSTLAAATTLAASLGLQRFYLINDTAITLAQTYEGYEFIGIGEISANAVTLGSQDVDTSEFKNLRLTGTQGGTGRLQASRCVLDTLDSLEITGLGCLIMGTLTVRNDGAFDQCSSTVAGSGTPILDINGVANVNVYWRHYSGGLQVNNAVATTVMSFEAKGQIIIDATCTSLDLTVRGNCSITDNGTTTVLTQDGAVSRTSINAEADTAISDAALATAANLATVDTVVDAIKVITDALGATAAANLAKSMSAGGLPSGAAVAGTLSTTQMTTDLTETTDDHYRGRVIIWTSGALLGQATDITAYSGATKLLTFTAVTDIPSATDTFVIV